MGEGPEVELERLTPGIDELGDSVVVGVFKFRVFEILAAEDAAQRALPLDEEGVEHLGACRLMRVIAQELVDLGLGFSVSHTVDIADTLVVIVDKRKR